MMSDYAGRLKRAEEKAETAWIRAQAIGQGNAFGASSAKVQEMSSQYAEASNAAAVAVLEYQKILSEHPRDREETAG